MFSIAIYFSHSFLVQFYKLRRKNNYNLNMRYDFYEK
jgi:hypothetical protein